MVNIVCPDKDLIPEIGSPFAAGMDLKSSIDFSLKPGQEISFGTGVKVQLPTSTFGLVLPRSSIAKHDGMHVMLKNTAGVIDSDYRGEIQVKMRNIGSKTLVVYKGDRVCQLVIVPHLTPTFSVVTELAESTRGEGGFGSSGGCVTVG